MLLKRINPLLNNVKIIPDTQFGFQNKHSSLHQVV